MLQGHLETKSKTQFLISEDGSSLLGKAFVDIKMKLPDWVPVKVGVIQRVGQRSMEKQICGDLEMTMEALANSTKIGESPT